MRLSSKVGTLGALNDEVVVDCSPFKSMEVKLTGTRALTVLFRASTDGGSTWADIAATQVKNLDSGAFEKTLALTGSADKRWRMNVVGANAVKIVASAYTSGSAEVQFTASITKRRRNANPVR